MKRIRLSTRTVKQVLEFGAIILACFLVAMPVTPGQADDAVWALQFDGINDYVNLGRTVDIMGAGGGWQTSKTVQLWVKPAISHVCPDPFRCPAIFTDRSNWWGITIGYSTLFNRDRIWIWNFDTNIDTLEVPYTPGEWVNIALVHGGGTLSAYRNGVLVDSRSSGATSQPDPESKYLLIGAYYANCSDIQPFQGQIDEVRIYNRALSGAEISEDLFNHLNGDETGLGAYYKMSDGTGSVLTDNKLTQPFWNGDIQDGPDGCTPPPGNLGPPQWVESTAFDYPGPTVTIDQAAGQLDPANASTITFDVVFSEAVTGFNNASGTDVILSGTAGATTATVSSISDMTYTVSVSGMAGDGTVIASIPPDAALDVDSYGNLASTSIDNMVTYDVTAPTATINQAPGQDDPTTTSPITFDVVFSEAVTGFNNAGGTDVVLSGTAGATTATVTGSGTTYTVSVSGMAGAGTVVASIPASAAQDAAGNNSTASTSTDNQVTYILYRQYMPMIYKP